MAAGTEYALANRYPIHRACRDGDTNALSELLQRVHDADSGKTNAFSSEDSFYGWMPIHWAAYHGQLACVRKLLTFASPEASSMNQLSQFGADETRLKETWNSLIDIRASNFRQTPVHLAAYGNHIECLKWLFDAGASPHLMDSLGETAAHKAARSGGVECLSLLLAHGVNLSVVNNAGQTAADIAAACGHVRCSAYLQRSQILQSGGAANFSVPASEDSSDMDIDQNAPGRLFVNGMYGYQPCFTKPDFNYRKRSVQAEPVLGPVNNGKRCKKSWRKDDDSDVAQQQEMPFMCAMKTPKSWMSGHCLM